MATSFLLRYEERYLAPEGAAEESRMKTNTKVLGEGADRTAVGAAPLTLPLAGVTKTAVKGEAPDRSFDALGATALPRGRSAKETLTHTFVHSEAPRNDDKRQGGPKVLPRAADHH